MHQNIKNKNSKQLDAKLFNQKYYDFMLYKGETSCDCVDSINSMLVADFSDLALENGKIYSSVQWSGATNSGVELKDIGLTGVDNGFIKFDKDRITNDEFLNLFFNSEYTIEPDDCRLFLSPVEGNTKLYSYDSSIKSDEDGKYLSLKGGFYQGFFKLHGFDYQVLPNKIQNDMVLHFDIRPRTDYTPLENTVNETHNENSGIFFYLGTRAENKFWEFYSGDKKPSIVEESDDDYFADEFYEADANDENCVKIEKDLTDSEGHRLDQRDYYEIETDNKFIFFNRTDTGFTVDNWVEGAKIKLDGIKNRKNINYFPWLNRTETGFTIDNINDLIENIDALEGKSEEEINKQKSFDILKDVKNNVFALRITEDGAIGYKYGILDCENELHYSVIEEYSKPGVITSDEWNSINIRFAVLNPTDNKCDNRTRKMKIMVYVNGFLKFISKELNTLSFRELDDVYTKQEGVPYNISIGGGSIGLLETILSKNCVTPQYTLPIEKDFCGTFIGDIKSFKMYMGFIDYCGIKNYLS